MALTVQNLRAVGVGVEPASLLPGQIAFNITDKVIYVGDGSNFKTNYDGTQVAGVPGNGWYAMPMDFDSLGEYYVTNPGYYGDVPTDGQVLSWSTALNHTIWSSGAGGGSQVYVVSNAAVAAAPGATTSAKITAAIGVASPDEGNVTIVTGLPDEVYEGLYFFTTEWVKGAAYAYPSASEVIYDNTAHPTLSATVQGAIDDLDDGLAATTAIANTANSTANSALSIASAALPKAGGVMTGDISFGSVGTGIIFNDSSNIRSISDSATSVSSITAGSSTAVKTAYDLAAAAVPRTSYTAAGDLIVGTGVGTFNALAVGTPGQILAVAPGGTSLVWVTDSEGDVTGVSGTLPITVDNTNPQVPVVGVNPATTATSGVVQIDILGNINVAGGLITVPNASTTVRGAVQLYNGVDNSSTTLALTAAQGKALQDQIDTLTLSNSVILAGGYDASTGLVDGVTSQGSAVGFMDNAAPPAASSTTVDHYVICTKAGSIPSTMANGDWLLVVETSPGVYAYQVLGVGARPPLASYTQVGVTQLADGAAVLAGTADALAITPQALQDNVIDSVATANSNLIASATAVKTANDNAVAAQTTANAALPKAGGTMTGNITFQDAGEGVLFNGGSAIYSVSDSISTTSSTIAASSTAAKAAYDIGAAAIPCSLVVAKGNIVAASAAGTPVALPVGTNGQVLVANSACSAGLEWVTDVPGDVTGVNATFPITVDNTDPQQPIIGINGASTIAAGAVQLNDTINSTSVLEAATANAVKTAYDIGAAAVPCSSFTALGNLLAGTGAGTYSALTVGTNGQFLSANSACGTGLEWCTLSLACVPCSAYTAVGTILAGNGAGTYCSLPVGTAGQLLVPNSACAAGVEWVTCSSLSLCGYTCTATPFNTALGANAGDSVTSGTDNVAIGFNAGTAITTGGQNIAIGRNALQVATSAIGNVAIGHQALTGASASQTTAVGFNALSALTSGVRNTAVGFFAGGSVVTGTDNTFIGFGAGDSNTGSASTLVGANAGNALTLGGANVFIGANAGDSVTTGFNNTIIGDVSGTASLTGNLILAAGTTIKFQANNSGAWSYDGTNFGTAGQFLASQGSAATPVWCTLSLACVPCSAFTACGDLLVGTGSSTFTALPTGTNNQILVVDTTCTATGGLKWATSQGASLCGFTCSTGNFSVALGFQAGAALTSTGFSNVFVGYNAGCQMSGGDYNVAVGNSSLQGTGSSNVAIGAGAMGQTASTGNNNVAIGYQSADALTSGANNIAIGQGSLGASTTASDQVAIGHQAGCTNTTGAQSVYVGSNAGLLSNSVGSVFVGFCAGQANTTAGCTTYLGYVSGRNATGLFNTYVGGLTGCAASNTSACGTLLGFCAGSALTTGNGNIFVGFQSGRNVNSGANNVAIGTAAFQTATSASSNVAVGCGALQGLSTSAGNTALGHRAMLNASTAANNVVIGCSAGEQLSTGSNNVLIGDTAGDSITVGTLNTLVGATAGTNAAATSEGNTGFGYGALGSGALSGAYNIAVGANAGQNVSSGALNTLVGYTAGSAITTGGSNTLVGRYAGTATLANNVVLSDGAGTIRFQSNSSGAISLGSGGAYGTAGQILTSSGAAAAPTWTSPTIQTSTATKSVTNATPVSLLQWSSGTRMGTLVVMATNGTDLAWANITVAAVSGVGYSVVTTQAGSFGTFAVIAGGSGETVVEFTPSATVSNVVFTYQYNAATGSQPTVL
jgi:hypothetical protein